MYVLLVCDVRFIGRFLKNNYSSNLKDKGFLLLLRNL